VISFGANDTAIEDGAVRVPIDRSRHALATVLGEARRVGYSPFVIGPAPVDDGDQNLRIGALTESFAQICEEHDTPFVGVLAPLLNSALWMSEVAAGDGAHPGADGYEALAHLLLERGLLAWLTQPV
jgi:acyl-CoA thioesterase-1